MVQLGSVKLTCNTVLRKELSRAGGLETVLTSHPGQCIRGMHPLWHIANNPFPPWLTVQYCTSVLYK